MKRWRWLLLALAAAGCGAVGGSSSLHPGTDFPPTGDDIPIGIYRGELPECAWEPIGTAEAHAPIDASADELDETEDHQRSRFLEEAEAEALRELRRRVREMGGHAVVDLRASIAGVRATDTPDFDDARRAEEGRGGSVSYTFGSGRPKYAVEGTVIRFSDPACMK